MEITTGWGYEDKETQEQGADLRSTQQVLWSGQTETRWIT